MKRFIASLLTAALLCSVAFTGCKKHERNHHQTTQADKCDKETIYLTGDPQEIADSVCDLILDADSVEDLKKLVSNHSNVMGNTLKKTLATLDGDIDDVECVYIDIKIHSPKESKNDSNGYTIDCFYQLTIDDEEYILEFEVILVDDYEIERHGLNILRIKKKEDFNLNNHRSDYVTPEEVEGHEVQEFVQELNAKHHKKVLKSDEFYAIPYTEELVEEILYCLEEEDDDALMDLYSDVNVNGREDIDDYKEDEVDDLMDIFGGEDLSAVGSVVSFYDYSLKPNYVDCDDVDKPREYIARYIVSNGDDEYKIQIIYIPYALSEDYYGIQSIQIIEEL